MANHTNYAIDKYVSIYITYKSTNDNNLNWMNGKGIKRKPKSMKCSNWQKRNIKKE